MGGPCSIIEENLKEGDYCEDLSLYGGVVLSLSLLHDVHLCHVAPSRCWWCMYIIVVPVALPLWSTCHCRWHHYSSISVEIQVTWTLLFYHSAFLSLVIMGDKTDRLSFSPFPIITALCLWNPGLVLDQQRQYFLMWLNFSKEFEGNFYSNARHSEISNVNDSFS
jgi:hypothetical protein